MWPWVMPFGLYMAFLCLESVVQSVTGSTTVGLWLYPVKTAAVFGTLLYFWRQYTELHVRLCVSGQEGAWTLGAGVLVYLAWVRMDWPWATLAQSAGYDPFQAGASLGALLAAVRLFGAAVVVPMMEELCWRSFLLRYVITLSPGAKTTTPTEFTAIPLGTFTPMSFLVTVVLFGSEHALWLAGMLAGAVYTLLLYKTRRLWPCVLAHGITNLLLGVHVLMTREWHWW